MQLDESSRSVSPPSRTRVIPFQEFQFIRLSAWIESNRDTSFLGGAAFAGRIFRRFWLQGSKDVSLDFSSTGSLIGADTAARFQQILSYSHQISKEELLQLRELLHTHACGKAGNEIVLAEVGEIDGRRLLAVRWEDSRGMYRYVSLFFPSERNNQTILEMHFAAPIERFDIAYRELSQTLRTIQWSCPMPPVAM